MLVIFTKEIDQVKDSFLTYRNGSSETPLVFARKLTLKHFIFKSIIGKENIF